MRVKQKYLFAGFGLLIGLLSFASLGSQAFAAPATFTVTTVADTGVGSLRAAIESANGNTNASDMDVITFNIAGSGVHTINLVTELPDITQKVTINGYSQTGASANTTISPAPMDSVIKIEINANALSGHPRGLNFESGAAQSVVRGLSVYGAETNISVQASNVEVKGNYISVDASGLAIPNGSNDNDTNNARGIQFHTSGSGLAIGGVNPADRNIITNKHETNVGAIVVDRNDALIYGNYIGIGRDGVSDLGGTQGISSVISGGGLIVGGTSTGMRNVISGSSITQVNLVGAKAKVQNNLIGTDYTGAVSSGITSGAGISIPGSTESLIGGIGANEGNVIKGVSGAGVASVDLDFTITWRRLRDKIFHEVMAGMCDFFNCTIEGLFVYC